MVPLPSVIDARLPGGLKVKLIVGSPVAGSGSLFSSEAADYLSESGAQPVATSPFFDFMTAWPVARSTMITLG